MNPETPLDSYPVRIEVDVPVRFERMQLLLRALILVAFGALHQSGPGLFGLSYVLLPAIAAVLISRRAGTGYLQRDAPWLISVLEWIAGFYAYMLLVTDSFPLESGTRALRVHAMTGGRPSVASALSRLLLSLPHFFLLALLGVVGAVLAVVAALSILIGARYLATIRAFQQELVGWIARVLVYHASLVEAFPPMMFERKSTSTEAAGAERPSAPLSPT
jgi:Domain of unknown function (DUF4389)